MSNRDKKEPARYSATMPPFVTAALFTLVGIGMNGSALGASNWASAAGGNIPADAIMGGKEQTGEPLYICRASYQGGVHPGKVRQGLGGCDIGYNGHKVTVPSYEVLVPAWQSATNGSIPPDALRGFGHEAPEPGQVVGPILWRISQQA